MEPIGFIATSDLRSGFGVAVDSRLPNDCRQLCGSPSQKYRCHMLRLHKASKLQNHWCTRSQCRRQGSSQPQAKLPQSILLLHPFASVSLKENVEFFPFGSVSHPKRVLRLGFVGFPGPLLTPGCSPRPHRIVPLVFVVSCPGPVPLPGLVI